jgi:hypothetical protein
MLFLFTAIIIIYQLKKYWRVENMAEEKKNKPYLSKNEPLGAKKKFEKQCQFPGCSNTYWGVGASKYCEEHQKQEYKKELLKMKEDEAKREYEDNNLSNIIIEHTNDKATHITRTCPCGKIYKLTLFPSVHIYPRYCPEHRNVHRRKKLEEELAKRRIING